MKLNQSFASLFAAAALALALPASAAVPPAEKLLPADTLAVLTIPDWDKSAAAAKGSSLAQFWRDPAMKPFAEKFERKLGELIGQADKDFAREWAEFKPLVGGQITLAVIRNEWQGEANTGPDFVALIDVKDKAKQLRDFLDKCEKTDADAGQTIQRETVRGVKFSRAVAKDAPKNDDAAAKTKFQPYTGQSGSLLLISESPKSLEKVLARLEGAGAGLDESPEFERARSTVGRDAHAFGWVNVKAFTGLLAKLPAGLQDANPLGLRLRAYSMRSVLAVWKVWRWPRGRRARGPISRLSSNRRRPSARDFSPCSRRKRRRPGHCLLPGWTRRSSRASAWTDRRRSPRWNESSPT